jgi:hypothetical protein
MKHVFYSYFNNNSPFVHILSQINPIEASVLDLDDLFQYYSYIYV